MLRRTESTDQLIANLFAGRDKPRDKPRDAAEKPRDTEKPRDIPVRKRGPAPTGSALSAAERKRRSRAQRDALPSLTSESDAS